MTPSSARGMVAAFEASRLSASAFSKLHELPKHRISYWRRRLSEMDAAATVIESERAEDKPAFARLFVGDSVPAVDDSASSSPAQTLEATLPSGVFVSVRGQWDSASIETWLSALGGGQC